MNILSSIASIAMNAVGVLVALLITLGAQVTSITTLPPQEATTTQTAAKEFPTTKTTISTSTTKTTVSKKPRATVIASSTTSFTPPVQTPKVDPDVLNQNTRAALVNILCTTRTGLAPISGSGIMIDNRGVVLTNAHVGQFFLLRDYKVKNGVDCVIRTGSPAYPAYTARLLYLPPSWIDANASQLKAQQATGTGEDDYSFLLITGTVASTSLPNSFAHLPMSTAEPDIGDEMLLAAYPAGFLSPELISSDLYASSAFAYVTQLFTFSDEKHVDLFSIGGSVESQAGSSGGAAVRLDGTLAGIITTAILSGSTGTRDLRAITLAHINRSLTAKGKDGIVGLLSSNLVSEADDFNTNIAPAETAALEKVLDSTQ